MPAEERTPWLVVSYFVNEGGMACSHHVDDRVPELQEKGIDLTLLSSLCVRRMPGVRHLRAPSLSPSGIRFEVRQVLKRRRLSRWRFKLWETLLLLPLYPFYLLEKLLLNIDTTWFWFPLAVVRGGMHCAVRRPKVIYSTGGPVSAHLVAAVLASWTGARWLAEFQDPLIHSYCSRSRFELRLLLWAERFICRRASRVVFLTDEARSRTEARSGIADCGGVIYPGSRPLAAQVDHARGEKIRFVHVGSLGGSRHLGGFLGALGAILNTRPELREVVRLSLYGSLGAEVMRQVEEFPFREVVEIAGRVSREEAIVEMLHSDVLLLVQNEDDISSETIPSKVYEYFHARRLILGLVYRNEELRKMLRSLGHIPVALDDPDDIRGGILAAVDRFRRPGNADPFEMSPYTVIRAVEMLKTLAETDDRSVSIAEG